METPGYNDRDNVYMEEDNSMQHEEDSVVLTAKASIFSYKQVK